MVFRRLLQMIFFGLVLSMASKAQTDVATTPAESWILLKTAHFEMFTTNTEQQARETLQLLENVRAFFEQTTLLIPKSEKPLRVIAFRSREEYAPFRLQQTSFAHYLHSRRGDYIVLQDISPAHQRAVIHEYTHHVFRAAGLRLPIWLCEGTADFYSSLELEGNSARLGGVLPSRFRSVSTDELIPLATLFSVNRESSFYNDPAKIGLFYGESWALVHMLVFDPSYRERFPEFIDAVNGGADSTAALQQVYQKSAAEVVGELRSYLPQISNNQTIVETNAQVPLELAACNLSEVEASLTKADLLAAHRSTAKQAWSRLEALRERSPGNAQAQEILAYLATQEGSPDSKH